jgi:hypothetical protein
MNLDLDDLPPHIARVVRKIRQVVEAGAPWPEAAVEDALRQWPVGELLLFVRALEELAAQPLLVGLSLAMARLESQGRYRELATDGSLFHPRSLLQRYTAAQGACAMLAEKRRQLTEAR